MIEVSNLKKSFGANHVLKGVSFTVAQGESLVVIGGSGTGKSVLLKCILGLETQDSGEIIINGKNINQTGRDAFLDQFGMLFQAAALFDSLSIWENVAFRLRQGTSALSRKEARDVAIEKLRRVGLKADVADKYPAELSGGMQKRAGLARAIAANPKIIFFDEPTTGLDPIMSGVINDLIREIVEEIGATTITITHDMSSVRSIAHKVIMLHQGEIRWFGAISDLDTSGNPYIEQFIKGEATGPIETIR